MAYFRAVENKIQIYMYTQGLDIKSLFSNWSVFNNTIFEYLSNTHIFRNNQHKHTNKFCSHRLSRFKTRWYIRICIYKWIVYLCWLSFIQLSEYEYYTPINNLYTKQNNEVCICAPQTFHRIINVFIETFCFCAMQCILNNCYLASTSFVCICVISSRKI